MYRVKLNEEDIEALSRPVVGQGGFQDLLRLLKSCVRGQFLEVSNETANRLVDYEGSYGQGGWQERIKRIARELRKQMSV